MSKQYKNPVMASIHETAENLPCRRRDEQADDAQIRRSVPDADSALTPAEIKALHEREARARPYSRAV